MPVPGRRAGQGAGGVSQGREQPGQPARGAAGDGTLLDKVLPEAKHIVVLAELVLELVRAALFVCQAGVDNMGLPAQPAALGGRQLVGALASARCTCRTECSCARCTLS